MATNFADDMLGARSKRAKRGFHSNTAFFLQLRSYFQ